MIQNSRTGILYILLLLLALSGFSQDQAKVDSLKNVLAESPQDTNRIKILVDLWRLHAYSDIKTAISYAEEILNFSEEIGYKNGIAAAYQRLGASYSIQGEDKKSNSAFFKALNLYRELKHKNLEGIILFNLGLGYKGSGLYDSTRYYFEKARVIFEESGNLTQKGAIYDGLSGVYFEQSSYQLCISHALKAVKLFEEAGDELRLADAQSKIGQASAEIKNYEDALKYFKKAAIIYRKNHDDAYELSVRKYMADAFFKMGEKDSSIYHYQQIIQKAEKLGTTNIYTEALIGLSSQYLELGRIENLKPQLQIAYERSKSLDNPALIVPALRNLGKYHYLQEKSYPLSESYFLKALKMAEKYGFLYHQSGTEAELAILYKNWGKTAKAIEHFFAHQAFKDSLLNLQMASRIAELQTLYESEKKDREIERQESEIKILQQKVEIDALNQKILLGGIALVSLLLLAVFLGYRQKLKRDQLIHEQEKMAYEQELLFQKKELASHTLHLVQKSDLLEELKAQLESTRKDSGDSKKELSQMIQLIKSDKHVEQDWQNFKTYFDRVHADFERKIRSRSENLSQNEYRLAALMKMDLSTKEIAGILNISPDSVHKGRYRLKKRLGLSGEENLREYLLGV